LSREPSGYTAGNSFKAGTARDRACVAS
jgi:hypothetical protein